jgi:hypothetical protein
MLRNLTKTGKNAVLLTAISLAQILFPSGATAGEILSYDFVLVSNNGRQCPYGFSPFNEKGYCTRNKGNNEGYILTLDPNNACPAFSNTTYAGGGYCMTTVNIRPPAAISNDTSNQGSTVLSNAVDMWADAFGGGKPKPQTPDSSLESLLKSRNISIFQGYAVDPKHTKFGSDASIFDEFNFNVNKQEKQKLVSILSTKYEKIPSDKLQGYLVRIRTPSGNFFDFAGVCYPQFTREENTGTGSSSYMGDDMESVAINSNLVNSSTNQMIASTIEQKSEFIRSIKFRILYLGISPESKCASKYFLHPGTLKRYNEQIKTMDS